MADSSGIRAGKAFVELLLKDVTFQRGLDKALGRMKSFGKNVAGIGAGMMGAGAAIGAPLVAMAQKAMTGGAELHRASERLGAPVEQISALKGAAEVAGVAFEEIEAGARKMQKGLAEGNLDGILREMGVDAKAFGSMGLREQFETIADALLKLPEGAIRGGAAMAIFGKQGENLLPFLNRGSQGIEELIQKLSKFGAPTSAGAKAAAEFEENLTILEIGAKKTASAIGGELLKAIAPYVPQMMNLATSTLQFIKDNKEMALTVAAVAAGLIAGGAAFVVIGTAIGGVASAVSGVVGAVTGIAGFLAPLIPLLPILIPIGLLVAGLAIGFYGAAKGTQTWKDAMAGLSGILADIGAAFDAFVGRVKEDWAGISEALKAGDMSLALKIAWASVQEEFARGWKVLRLGWFDVVSGIGMLLRKSVAGWKILFVDLVSSLELQLAILRAAYHHPLNPRAAAREVQQEFDRINEEGWQKKIDIIKGVKGKEAEEARERERLEGGLDLDIESKRMKKQALIDEARKRNAVEQLGVLPKEIKKVAPPAAAVIQKFLEAGIKGMFGGSATSASLALGDTKGTQEKIEKNTGGILGELQKLNDKADAGGLNWGQ